MYYKQDKNVRPKKKPDTSLKEQEEKDKITKHEH